MFKLGCGLTVLCLTVLRSFAGRMLSGAVQRLMEACLKSGQRKSDELRLKGALAELRGFVRLWRWIDVMLR